MAFDRFRITAIDYSSYTGTVLQLTAEHGLPTEEPVHFDIMRASAICYAFDGDGLMYGAATPSIRQRLPEVGMELVGVIARDGNNQLVRDTDGHLFLRNWAYADQYDEGVVRVDNNSDDEPQLGDMEDGYVPSGEVYRRAYAHTGNHELAREALELYPGDYI
jgi:hypothetical protein